MLSTAQKLWSKIKIKTNKTYSHNFQLGKLKNTYVNGLKNDVF